MRRLAAVAATTVALVVVPAAVASAHPLGNFTVNHYDGLTVRPDGIDVHAVVDAAEIPTAQTRPTIDRDGDGRLSPAERAAYATRTCADLTRAEVLAVQGTAQALGVSSSSYLLRPGAAGLSTSRLTCDLHATADLRGAATNVTFTDRYAGDRIGWHEITAVAVGVRLNGSAVPARSVSDELRHYPNDLLTSPLDVRQVTLSVLPGAGPSTYAGGTPRVPTAGLLTRVVERVSNALNHLTGARHLTLGVGLLAVLVSLLLGAMHAMLPGHGKTVMAAYLAGKRGSRRDALVVGATVTATHTGGVLAVGLALTASANLVGDHLLAELGVGSGALVVAVGLGLLLRARRRPDPHDHPHPHPHHTDGDHPHPHHDHAQHDDPRHPDGDHPHPHHDHARRRPVGRAGLVGMGIAGGLVPSPSALVVLLGAIALGRTAFGVALVVTYGLGMAATLTLAGLLAVRLSDRARQRWGSRRALVRLSGAAPVVTGVMVVAVGLGLTVRSVLTI